jgi:outer membrane protein assembly factor BamB
MNRLRTLVAVLVVVPAAAAADWPGWLGPRRDGSTTETVKPWPAPLKILWKQPVGEGHSSPVVAGGKVYLHTRVGGKNEEALAAFDAATGKPLWQTAYDRGNFSSLFGNGPRATPSVVGGRAYTFGITGILTCFDADAGTKLWQVDTLKRFKAPNLFFGASCSPLVEGDLVLVNVGGKGASLVALDRANGETRWAKLDDKASYSSPIAVGQGGERQAIFLTAAGLVSVAPADGKVFWQIPLVDKLAESSTTPVVNGDMLFASSITVGGIGVKLSPGPKAEQKWMKPELNCYFSTPVAVGKDHLFVVTGTRPPALTSKATLRCVETATGKELWNRDRVGTYHASLLRTGDGKVLLLEEAGDLVLLAPDVEKYHELARSKICGKTWAHPALANGRLYVRDEKELVCVGVE